MTLVPVLPAKLPGNPAPTDGCCNARLTKVEKRYSGIGPRYCGRRAGHGTDHLGYGQCKYHGGSTPNAGKAAQKQMVNDEARKISEMLGDADPVDDPVQALLDLTAQIVRWKDIATLKMDELSTLDYADRQGVQRAAAIVELWERAVDRCMTALVQVQKLELATRRLELQEWQGRLIGETVLAILASPALSLEDWQLELARSEAGSRLAELAPQLRPDSLRRIEDIEEILDAEIVEE